jgi:hypothetical protein
VLCCVLLLLLLLLEAIAEIVLGLLRSIMDND